MPTVLLARTVVEIAGPDAEHLLQSIITTDLGQLGSDEARPGALLSPQGKILFDFLVSRSPGGTLRLDVRSETADDLVRRLTLYRLRAKVAISKQDQLVVAASWETDSAASQNDSESGREDSSSEYDAQLVLSDTRFLPSVDVRRIYGTTVTATGSLGDWTLLRIRHAVAESGSDYELGDAFPHDVLLDQNGGVGFAKGCYVGQEVVSRMQHRGTARRRVLHAEGAAKLPVAGTPITADGKPIGQLGSVQDEHGLAIVRIDRAKDAMDGNIPVMADDVPLTLSIPGWARFAFPERPGVEEA